MQVTLDVRASGFVTLAGKRAWMEQEAGSGAEVTGGTERSLRAVPAH